jgi:kynureninase
MTGWFSHAAPFAFEPGAIRYAKDITRTMGGSPSVPALYAARSGYGIIRTVGVGRIREKSVRQTRLLIRLADAQGLTVNTPREDALRAGTVSVDFRGSEKACDALIRRGFLVDHRPRAGIRISPHFYNSDAECEAVMEEIRALRRR